MKDMLKNMNKAFDSRVRIAIMSLLLANEWVDFNSIKETLGITDGNLASHTTSLERKRYIEVTKKFVGKRPNTSYKATELGKIAFFNYVACLRQLLPAQSLPQTTDANK